MSRLIPPNGRLILAGTATRWVQNLSVATEQRASLLPAAADCQSLAARHPVRQIDRLLARPVPADNRGNRTAEVVELQFTALQGDNGNARISRLPPVHYRIENVFERHAALFRQSTAPKGSDDASSIRNQVIGHGEVDRLR